MSIRTNPMKAVTVLLKRVSTVRSNFMREVRDESLDGKLEKLTRELKKIEDVFMRVKKNQDALLDTLHHVDSHLRNLDRTWLNEDMDGICRRIRDCAQKLVPMDSFESDFGSQWLDTGTTSRLSVLQLGRWQDSPSHHIEVGSQEFLKHLSHLKYLKYLSLRGISRIFELPPSIAQLERLEILDLKACHNLEALPDDISSMKSLTHLILSQCYLLDGMPWGIDKLTKLQVLKGFVIGSSRNTPCTISDLANLKELRRLSIHIGKEAVIKDMKFETLRKMSRLEHLKISWGVSDTSYSDIQIILPSTLKKLHLEGFPGQVIPEWLKTTDLPWGLTELNITGGKLSSMSHVEVPFFLNMEIVRLKYVKYLKIDLKYLQKLFPGLMYALIKPIPNHSYMEWSYYRE